MSLKTHQKLIMFINYLLITSNLTHTDFFTYSTARRRRRHSGRYMYMFSQHRKLDFCKIISLISDLICLQKLR